MPYSGHFRIVDVNGRRADIPIRGALSLVGMQQFCQRFSAYLTGNIQKTTHTESELTEIVGVGGEEIAVTQGLKMFMRNVETGDQRMLEMPTMTTIGIYEHLVKRGYMLKAESGELFTAWFSDLIGEPLTFEHGRPFGDPF